jgi:hypothetical protein
MHALVLVLGKVSNDNLIGGVKKPATSHSVWVVRGSYFEGGDHIRALSLCLINFDGKIFTASRTRVQDKGLLS